ncbi:MAG: hypothetical protein AAGA48_13815 [Myxococcota bacterium]
MEGLSFHHEAVSLMPHLHRLDRWALVDATVLGVRRALPLLEDVGDAPIRLAHEALTDLRRARAVATPRLAFQWYRRLSLGWGAEVPIPQRLAWRAVRSVCVAGWRGTTGVTGVSNAAAALAANRCRHLELGSRDWREATLEAYAAQCRKTWRMILGAPGPAYRPMPALILTAPPADAVAWDAVADVPRATFGRLVEVARRNPDLRLDDTVASAVAIRRALRELP